MVMFAGCHVWNESQKVLFVLAPISPDGWYLLASLSLSLSLCLSGLCMSSRGRLHMAAGWITRLQGQPALSAVILTWLYFYLFIFLGVLSPFCLLPFSSGSLAVLQIPRGGGCPAI